MDCEFDIVKSSCPFCGQHKTIGFNEHYYFCPNCSSIYTYMINRPNCKHVDDITPFVLRLPWYKEATHTTHIIECDGVSSCSKCGEYVELNGW